MELRKLKSEDLFSMFGILSKIGFEDIKKILTPDRIKELTKVVKNNEKKDEVDMNTILGFNIIFEIVSIVLKNLPACKKDLYNFLSSLSGLKPSEIAELPLADFTEMIVSVIKKEEFKDFFKVVSKLFK